MNEIPQMIPLDELKPGETFGQSRNLDRPVDFTYEDILIYLRADSTERRRIEIATLGYPLTLTSKVEQTENKEKDYSWCG